MLFVEYGSKHYYVTNEIMKRCLILCYYLSVINFILLYKKSNISFTIFLLLYGFHRFKQKILESAYFTRVTLTQKLFTLVNFLKICLSYKTWEQKGKSVFSTQLYSFCSYWHFAVWAEIGRSKNVWHYITLRFFKVYLGSVFSFKQN